MAVAVLIFTADAAMTAAFAGALAADLRAGDTILLKGQVGAGKSHFARALIRARLGNPLEDVPSPTYTLVQTYEADPVIWHADLYRLTAAAEVDELGLTDALPDAIVLIEWPDRMALSGSALTVTLTPTDDPEMRQIELSGEPDLLARATRAAGRATFAHAQGWGGDTQSAFLAGDASARRYYRLCRDDASAVLMDTDATTLEPYLAMTKWLRARDFHAPRVLVADVDQGLALIEDLGDAQLARVIEGDPAEAEALYIRVADLLSRLASYPPAPGIPALGTNEIGTQVQLFAEWYPIAAGANTAAQQAADQIAPLIERLHSQLCCDVPPVTCLRDFHAENVILTPDDRLGLVDFQDAVSGHPAYDLVSVLHDPRRALPKGVEQAAIDRFLAATGFAPDRFNAAFALLGAQRNLRIMGIFTRLCVRDGKPRYLDFMERTWSLIRQDVSHPALAELAALIETIPAPTPEIIERIRALCCH